MRILTVFFGALVLAGIFIIAVEAMSVWKTRKLLSENSRLRVLLRTAEDQNDSLQRDEPEKIKELRERIDVFNTTIDVAIAILARTGNSLDVTNRDQRALEYLISQRPNS